MNPSKAYVRAQENNDSVNFGSDQQIRVNRVLNFQRVNKYQKVTQEGRDEGRTGMAFIAFLWFIPALIEGVEQKGPFYVYGQQKDLVAPSPSIIWAAMIGFFLARVFFYWLFNIMGRGGVFNDFMNYNRDTDGLLRE